MHACYLGCQMICISRLYGYVTSCRSITKSQTDYTCWNHISAVMKSCTRVRFEADRDPPFQEWIQGSTNSCNTGPNEPWSLGKRACDCLNQTQQVRCKSTLRCSNLHTADQSQCEVGVNVRFSVSESHRNGQTRPPPYQSDGGKVWGEVRSSDKLVWWSILAP